MYTRDEFGFPFNFTLKEMRRALGGSSDEEFLWELQKLTVHGGKFLNNLMKVKAEFRKEIGLDDPRRNNKRKKAKT